MLPKGTPLDLCDDKFLDKSRDLVMSGLSSGNF